MPTEEQQRITALYRKFGQVIYRRCLKLLRDEELAFDATQEVFLKLSRQLTEFDGDARAFAWIYRVATHHCLDVVRNAARQRQRETDFAEWKIVADVGLELFPDRQLAASVLKRFDETTQAVALGVLVDGMQHEELAAALGISRRTVARKLERFLVDAKKYLARSDA